MTVFEIRTYSKDNEIIGSKLYKSCGLAEKLLASKKLNHKD